MGDGNPLNELKPEVTAPGTNIVQAEGCVTSAGCHNDLPGQDAHLVVNASEAFFHALPIFHV